MGKNFDWESLLKIANINSLEHKAYRKIFDNIL